MIALRTRPVPDLILPGFYLAGEWLLAGELVTIRPPDRVEACAIDGTVYAWRHGTPVHGVTDDDRVPGEIVAILTNPLALSPA